MTLAFLDSGHKFHMEVAGSKVGQAMVSSTGKPKREPCLSPGHRHCADGSCMDLCPEDQVMNQNTVLIMIAVGISVVIFLMILYCFQQRSQRSRQNGHGMFESASGEGETGERASLNNPPPPYDEVINSNLYPPTPVAQRAAASRTPSVEEPRTPPPNYDMALCILANNHESVLPSKQPPTGSVVRRSVSSEQVLSRTPVGAQPLEEIQFRRPSLSPNSR